MPAMTLFHPHAQAADGSKLKEAVDRCIFHLKGIKDDFDIIAVRGASGMVVGSIVAWEMGKRLMVIRKDNEHVHMFASYSMYGTPIPHRTVFLDDFIESGRTYNSVVRILGEHPKWVMLYDTDRLYRPDPRAL